MFNAGAVAIDANKDYVDSLNVFPVPDGDTGINMTLTMKSVIKEVDGCPSNELTNITACVTRGGLRGARGNSGVILSQIFKGMMVSLARPVDNQMMGKVSRKVKNVMSGGDTPPGRVSHEVTTKQFAKAIEEGAKVAYSAVTTPREGTILTVIRVMGEEAKKIAKIENDFIVFFQKLMVAGEDILAKTPELLPVLKKAGVVDSGGRGLLIIFSGFLGALDGSVETNLDFSKDGTLKLDSDDGMEEFGDLTFAYCTEFNITNMNRTTTMANIDSLRDKLCGMGDSVVCVGDLDMLKVHVHTNTPGEALTAALNLGEIINLKIDNMLQQQRELFSSQNVEQKEQGMVAVAAGEGLATIFKDLGVDYIIKGGQTMNPSAEDIARACSRVHAKTVFVFPNNKNIILAARHAGDLCNKKIVVIPTKSINEGIACCMAYDESSTVEENTDNFNAAAVSIKSGQVTYAVRNTSLGRFTIKEGEVLGLDNSGIVAKGTSISDVTTRLIDKLKDENTSSVTIFYGESVKEKDANALAEKLTAKHPNIDVSMIDGGQPVYYYLISVE